MKKRYVILVLVNLICLTLAACNSMTDKQSEMSTDNVVKENISVNDSVGNTSTDRDSSIASTPTKESEIPEDQSPTSEAEINNPETTSPETTNSETTNPKTSTTESSTPKTDTLQEQPNIVVVNYDDCFQGIDGCAVFYDPDTNEYQMYHKELCEEQASPCSTFKIVSTLIGLENGVLDSVDTTMGYDETIYPNESWNKDMSLKEAFQSSCVWYFRKVIDKIGPDKVQAGLNELKYGNCDISEWEGSGINPSAETNGFWLESSLKISPVEMVTSLSKIFEERSRFSRNNIDILKEVILVKENESASVYGKTGTGVHGNAWFSGMIEKGSKRYYFAVRLTKDSKEATGQKAKEIALEVIQKYYSQH